MSVVLLGHNSAVTFASKCRLFAGDTDGSRLGDTSNFIRRFVGPSDMHTMFASENAACDSAESRLHLSNKIK